MKIFLAGLWLVLSAPGGDASPQQGAAGSSAGQVVLTTPVYVEDSAATEPRLGPAQRESLEAELRRSVGATDMLPVSLDDACDATCVSEAGSGEGFAVAMRVTAVGPDFEVVLDLVDLKRGEVAGSIEQRCEICGLAELEATLRDAATAAGRQIDAALVPAALSIRSDPPGASVAVDGELVGVTPLEVHVTAGEHSVRIQAPGYFGRETRVSASDSVVTQVALTLQAVPQEPEDGADRSRRRPLRAAGIAALVLGGAGVGTGAALLILNDRPIKRDCGGANQDVDGDCKWRHDTLVGGAVSLGVGVAAIAAGVAMLVIDRKRQNTARVRVVPTGFGAALVGRF